VTFALGARSLSYCTRVDPRLMAVVARALTLSTVDACVTQEQTRTPEQEQALIAAGRSTTMHSHHIIGYGEAAPGCSGAIDLVPWIGQPSWDWNLIYPLAAAMRQASIDLATPITWGGCWSKLMQEIAGSDATAMQAATAGNRFPDGPHFELGRN
jgi:peptidoglycan LD-endopeptidase CwlK